MKDKLFIIVTPNGKMIPASVRPGAVAAFVQTVCEGNTEIRRIEPNRINSIHSDGRLVIRGVSQMHIRRQDSTAAGLEVNPRASFLDPNLDGISIPKIRGNAVLCDCTLSNPASLLGDWQAIKVLNQMKTRVQSYARAKARNINGYYRNASPVRKYNYPITRKPASRGRVHITIALNGEVLGERTTCFPCLYAVICCHTQAYKIDQLRKLISLETERANDHQALQRRDPVAVAKDEWRGRFCEQGADEHTRLREQRIATGWYAEAAKGIREQILRCEERLARLLAGQEPPHWILFVQGWHETKGPKRKLSREFEFVDLVEVQAAAPIAPGKVNL